MNDAKIAADVQEEHRMEAHDFVEMGRITEETKGGMVPDFYDGGIGWFKG